MWLTLTAQVNAKETKTVDLNMDLMATFAPANSAPTMIVGIDGALYPVRETSDQIRHALRNAEIGAVYGTIPDAQPPRPTRRKR